MSRFEVDSDQVDAAAGRAQGSVVAIRTESDLLMRHLEELQSSWRGQAATALAGVAADWRAMSMRLEEALQSIQAALAHAGRQYADVEAANTRMFAG